MYSKAEESTDGYKDQELDLDMCLRCALNPQMEKLSMGLDIELCGPEEKSGLDIDHPRVEVI